MEDALQPIKAFPTSFKPTPASHPYSNYY